MKRHAEDSRAHRPAIEITYGRPFASCQLLPPEAFPETLPDRVERETVDGIPPNETGPNSRTVRSRLGAAVPAGQNRQTQPSSLPRCAHRIRVPVNAPSSPLGPARRPPATSFAAGSKKRTHGHYWLRRCTATTPGTLRSTNCSTGSPKGSGPPRAGDWAGGARSMEKLKLPHDGGIGATLRSQPLPCGVGWPDRLVLVGLLKRERPRSPGLRRPFGDPYAWREDVTHCTS